jgi:hypothetical protein
MRNHNRNFALLAFACLITACTQFTLVEQSKRVSFDETYSLDPQIAWSKQSQDNVELWTVDGPLLQELIFFSGVKDNEPLFPTVTSNTQDKLPNFDEKMTALEVRDLLVATLSRRNQFSVETKGLRPWRFGNIDGFRFETSLVTEDGLNKQGFAVGTIRDNKLYLISYSAAEVHYFGKYKDTVERLLSSIVII